MFRIVPNTKNSANISLTSISVTESVRLNAGYGEDFNEEQTDLFEKSLPLSRCQMKILDYKQFLAARKIQNCWRTFQEHNNFLKRIKSAIIIQKWWRRFRAQRNIFRMVENLLQNTVEQHHLRACVKIQSLWRGWWVRQTVHDMHSLKHIQLTAAEDLLHCVAFKLHHLLRTYSIPGVYSIRNSSCLSKVERLLASLNFRFHNERVRAQRAYRDASTNDARNRFGKSKFSFEAPYPGPNYSGLCPTQCEDFYRTKDLDKRMYKIIAMYEEATKGDERAKQIKKSLGEKRKRKKIQDILDRQSRLRNDFCSDVIYSMKKWKILDQTALTINDDIFRTPENVESFLIEVSSYLDTVNVMCHCKPKNIEMQICH